MTGVVQLGGMVAVLVLTVVVILAAAMILVEALGW